jgi:4-amino-4-deoxy-L-arabinose transferase-like glycosyltransferase
VRSDARFWALVGAAELLFAVQGLHLARVMLTWPDESGYVHLGYLATTGQISLFQDDFPGLRMPLPFYIVGLSQVIWGRDLLAARLVSLALSLIAVLLVALLARRLSGDWAGGLAALFFATQGVIVGYFSTATYNALGACVLIGGLLLIVAVSAPAGPLLGMATISLLFITRTNMWPVLPAVLGILLWQTRGAWRRLLLVVAASAVPLGFLLWSPSHAKMLAYVPGLGRWLAPTGFVSTLALTDAPVRTLHDRVWAIIRILRMYEFWWLAAGVLVLLIALCWLKGRDVRPVLRGRWVWLLGLLLCYIWVWQFFFFWGFPKTLAAYFPTFAPLLPILLGVGYARLLHETGLAGGAQAATLVVLLVLLVAPVVVVRHPLLPLPTDGDASATSELAAAGAHMARLIPPGAQVFLWGDSLPLYLAGRMPYLRQIHSAQTLAVVQDPEAIRRNGLWGMVEMEAWLGKDADYAVIQVSLLEHYRNEPRMPVRAMEELLARHFEKIATVHDYRWFAFDVYRRRSST